MDILTVSRQKVYIFYKIIFYFFNFIAIFIFLRNLIFIFYSILLTQK